jgi:hypothetical protein
MKALITYLGAAALLLACAVPVRAQQVQAALAQETAAVGQPVQLNISITGGSGVRLPDRINIEGLDIRFAGKSEQTQVTMNNGRLNAVTSAIYTYMIIPIKPGTFTIPALSLQVAGKVLKTAPLTLTVGGTPGGTLPGNVPVLPAIPVPQSQGRAMPGQPQVAQPQNPNPPSEDEIAYGDFVLPRKTAFVGEVVPVEIRFFFNADYPVRLQDKPSFTGDGFTVMNFTKPVQREQEINGQRYNVVTFQTAITPAKAGTLEISPAEIESQIQFPFSGHSRQDDFFGGLFGSMGDRRDLTVKTKPISLEVKALPKEGRPADFGGAIGQFSIAGSANPRKAAAGDALSLNVTVSGRGNFDAMGAPVLIEDEGWRTYPPGEKFVPSPSDPIGFNGEKRYEYMILAREDRSLTPVAEFTYFDPSLEKYVTLKTPPVAVEAKGGGSPAPAPAVAAAAAPTAQTPAPAAAATPEETGEPGVLARNFSPATFEPFAKNKVFLAVNGALALTWAAALLFGIGRVVSQSKSAREAAARKETRKLLHKMAPTSCATEQFYQHAADFVAARLGSHSREALESAPVSAETKSAVAGILDTHDEMKYSTTGSAPALSVEDRRRMVAQLKSFDEELS